MDAVTEARSAGQNRTRKIIHGAAWMYGRMIVTNILNVVVMAILARRLTPADFGLVALSYVIMQLLTLLGTEGVNQYVIQDHGEGREDRVQAAFWLDFAMSWLCTGMGIILLPIITRFYDAPGLGAIVLAMLLFFPVKSISKVPDALLKQALDFKPLEIRDTLIEAFVGLASVVMVLAGFGVWSIVAPGLAASVIRAAIVYRLTAWRPRLSLHLEHWPVVLRYYWNIMGSAITSYVLTDGDTLLIGKLMGNRALGLYNLGWQSANLVNRTIIGLANKLALPALASASREGDRAAAVLGRMMQAISIVAFPALVGLFVIAEEFILVVYGRQWQEAVLPMRILIVFALRHAVSPPIGAFFQARGRPDIPFRLGLANTPFYLAAIWFGSRWGIVGVAAAVTVVRTAFGFVAMEIVARHLGVKLRDVLRPTGPALMASCIMGMVLFLAKQPMDQWMVGAQAGKLLLLVATGAGTYLVLLRSIFRSTARELAEITAPLLGRYQFLAERVLRTT